MFTLLTYCLKYNYYVKIMGRPIFFLQFDKFSKKNLRAYIPVDR